AGFFAACGAHFPALVRLGVLALIVYGAVFRWLQPLLLTTLYGRLTHEDIVERRAFVARMTLYLVFGAVLVAINLLFDYARIRIVDDEGNNVEILRRILNRAGFTRIESTTDSRDARRLYIRHRPDLVLLDLHMPHLDGLGVMAELAEIAEATYLPILIL